MKLLNYQNLLIASLLGLSTLFADSPPLVKAQVDHPTIIQKIITQANVTPTTKPTVISKKSGVNYTRLRKLLAAGKWKEADGETSEVVERVAKRVDFKWDKFPCEDLRTINQLWLHYSHGKFGFSVQKEIYESLGGTRDYSEEVWDKFANRVGWRKREDEEFGWPEDLTYNVELAPKAHLPTYLMFFRRVFIRSILLSRAKTCNL